MIKTFKIKYSNKKDEYGQNRLFCKDGILYKRDVVKLTAKITLNIPKWQQKGRLASIKQTWAHLLVDAATLDAGYNLQLDTEDAEQKRWAVHFVNNLAPRDLVGELLDYKMCSYVCSTRPAQKDALQNYVLEKDERDGTQKYTFPEGITIFSKEQTKNI